VRLLAAPHSTTRPRPHLLPTRPAPCPARTRPRTHAARPQDDRTLHKILRLDANISLAFAGLAADARVLVNKARIECQSHRLTVEDEPSVEYIARHIGTTQQRYTQRGGVRPFGLAVLMAGVGADGKPQLWSSDPSGVYSAWKANAVGRSSKALLELLEKNYVDGCDGDAALRLAVSTLLEVVESGAQSIEVAVSGVVGVWGVVVVNEQGSCPRSAPRRHGCVSPRAPVPPQTTHPPHPTHHCYRRRRSCAAACPWSS
jgi:20S proteasome alpha/beta subunit